MTAFLFDCDGVLIDSETLSVTELGRALRASGAKITDDEIFARMIGRPIAEIVAIVADEQGFDATPQLAEFRVRLAARFDAELTPVPGMVEALRSLPSAARAVASSSTLPRLEHSLKLCGMWQDFAPHIYSATQVERGKPAPDLFQFAAQKLGVSPAECIVIEDSAAGIAAARAAGMRVVGFLGGNHAARSHLAKRMAELTPDAVVETADQLPETLRAMMAEA